MDTHDARPSEPVVTNAVVAAWQPAYADAEVSAASEPPPMAASEPARATTAWLCDANDPDARVIEAFFTKMLDAGDGADVEAEPAAAWVPVDEGARRAMWVALSMFTLSSLAIGGYEAYHRFVMPVPVELGDARGHRETSLSPASDPLAALQPSAAAAPPTWGDWLEVAQSFADEGQDKRALEAYDRALALHPGAAAALAGKAQAHLKLNERAAAKELAAQAVSADPRNGLGWFVLGSVEESLGARAAAQDAYRHCADQAEGSYAAECRKLLR